MNTVQLLLIDCSLQHIHSQSIPYESAEIVLIQHMAIQTASTSDERYIF